MGRIEGTYDSVIALQESSNNSGIAINSSGSLLAVTNASSDTISIYQYVGVRVCCNAQITGVSLSARHGAARSHANDLDITRPLTAV